MKTLRVSRISEKFLLTFLIATCFAFPQESHGANFCISALSSLTHKIYTFNADDFYNAKRYYLSESQPKPPQTNEEKMAFVEAMIAKKAEAERSLEGSQFFLTDQNRSALLKLMKKWNVKKGLSFEELYSMFDALYVTKNLSPLNLESWKYVLENSKEGADSILRQRWQTELYARGVFKTLQDTNLVPTRIVGPITLEVKRVARILGNILLLRMSTFQLTQTKNYREEIDAMFDEIIDNPDGAYNHFVQKHKKLARTEFYLTYFRKVAQLSLLAVFAFQTSLQIDHKIYPVEGFWTSKEAVIEVMVDEAKTEYVSAYGTPMSQGMQKYLQTQFEKESLRSLIYQQRDQK